MFPPPGELEITCEALAALRQSGEKLRLIDCREQDEWDTCHIDGAELSPLTTFAEEAPRRFTDSSEPLVVYCHHGMRSARVATFLRQKGHSQTWSLAGGIEQWAEEIEPGMARY